MEYEMNTPTNQEIADCFRVAKVRIESGQFNFICLAIYCQEKPTNNLTKLICANIIQDSLGGHVYFHKWLWDAVDIPNIDKEHMAYLGRLAWLDKLIFDYENRSR